MGPRYTIPTRHRRAAVTLEAILTLPVIVIAFFAAFQFAMKTMYQSSVVHAATTGAREAGKGANVDTVAGVVNTILDVNDIAIVDAVGSGTLVILEDGDSGTTNFGDATTCSAPGDGTPTSGEVRVTVCVKLENTPFFTVFCNGLPDLGLSFAGTTLRASSLVKKE